MSPRRSTRGVLPGTKLVASVVVVVVLLAALAGLVVRRIYLDDRDAVVEEQARLGFEAAADSAQYVRGRLDVLSTFARRPSFQTGDATDVADDLDRFPAADLALDGGIAWYATDGSLLASGRDATGTTSEDAVAAVTTAASTAAPFVSPALESPEFDGPVILLAVPTFDELGRANGVLATGLRLSWLDLVAERIGATRGGRAFIFDRAGEQVAGERGDGDVEVPVVGDLPGAREQNTVVYAAVAGATDPAGRSGQVIGYATEDSVTGWTSLEARSESTAFAGARRTLVRSLVGIGALAATVLVAAGVVGRRLNRLARRAAAAEVEAAAERRRADVDEANLGLALSATETGWFQWDVGSEQLHWSPLLSTIMGTPRAEGPPTVADAIGLVHPDHRAGVRRALTRAVEAGESVETEFRLTGPDPDGGAEAGDPEPGGDATATAPGGRAGPRWAWLYVSPIRDPAGAVRQIVGLVRDVTDRRLALEAVVRAAERERGIAETLQRNLLPSKVPTIEGLRFATRYRAAGPDTVVGGDFYDVTDLGDGRHSFVVGDVCGRGIEAAAVTSLARHTLRAAARHTDDPSDDLRWLHDALVASAAPGFVTCVAAHGRFDGDDYVVDLALGGHPPPILLRGGAASFVGSPGTLLGVLDPALTTTQHRLLPGDRLVLYTDGLTDSATPRLTDDDLLTLVVDASHLDLQPFVDALLRRSAPAAGRRHDDTALVVLDVRTAP